MTEPANDESNPENCHINNPYYGADKYINPDYAALVETSIAESSDPDLVAKMRSVQNSPTAIWLDRIESIPGGDLNHGRSSLEQHFINALAQQRKAVPMLIELVVYNLPNRDCAALSSNGTLDYRTGGLDIYKRAYIDPVATLIEAPRFAALRIVIILEPDSLPNMITNLWHSECAFVNNHDVYLQGIQYAIERLTPATNSYIYMDIGHSGWLGWDKHLTSAVAYFSKVIAGAKTGKGLSAVDGFITNISGTTPTEEPFLSNSDMKIDGTSIKSADFYEWNRILDEKSYVEALYRRLVQAGFPCDLNFLIDTSRNGWGGINRPSTTSSATKLNDYVDQSRIDRRFHRGNWSTLAAQA